jgi:hypothetical protein
LDIICLRNSTVISPSHLGVIMSSTHKYELRVALDQLHIGMVMMVVLLAPTINKKQKHSPRFETLPHGYKLLRFRSTSPSISSCSSSFRADFSLLTSVFENSKSNRAHRDVC